MSNWMEQNYSILYDREMANIILPGTHDSGAYKLELDKTLENKNINTLSKIGNVLPCVKEIIKNWTLTQNKSLYEQLKMGIRCLDLRLSYDKKINDYYVTHSFVLLSITDAFEQIKKFLYEHNKEVVVVTIKDDWTHRHNYDNSYLMNKIHSVINQNNITRDTDKTYGEMLANNLKMILLTRFNAPWIDTDNADVKYNFLLKELSDFNSYNYNILSFTVTPQPKNIVLGILAPCTNIKTISNNIHKKFNTFHNEQPKPNNTSCIMFDYPNNDLIKTVITYNT